MSEPICHSHITDVLDDDHPLIYEMVYCETCNVMVHACNNECMQTWFEFRNKNFCGNCFAKILIESEGVLG